MKTPGRKELNEIAVRVLDNIDGHIIEEIQSLPHIDIEDIDALDKIYSYILKRIKQNI